MKTIQMQVPDNTRLEDIYYAANYLGCQVHEYGENNILTFRPSEDQEEQELKAGMINGV